MGLFHICILNNYSLLPFFFCCPGAYALALLAPVIFFTCPGAVLLFTVPWFTLQEVNIAIEQTTIVILSKFFMIPFFGVWLIYYM